ncbi:MAG: hypothetical protein N2037_08060 [Acidimicrobiales bacterium]|nr:hypothetical protein [Acidimicrobiales bacterium]
MTDVGAPLATELNLRPPRDVEELGVPSALVHDITLRRALFEGRTSTLRLSDGLCISPALVSKVVEELRELRYLEVQGLDGRDYQLALTELGREQANERMRLSRYSGAIPVSLDEYRRVVRQQEADVEVTRERMRRAFSDLVVNDALLDELGPALIAQGAMFLYGPPGTGKTSIAERLIRIHEDVIVVPRAVEVDSQVITVFDPVVHEPVENQPYDLDPRWVVCRRPAIIAGGELTADMLDLQYEPNNGIYLAPLHMQANNGIFVIDDFGRQSMTPSQLLNRWIVPLDRRVDFLSLSYGVKFEIPFETKVVLSTNLDPSSLGDEAFFRRIQNKIFVKPISDEEFDEVLRRCCEAMGIVLQDGAAEYLRKVSREQGDGDLRPYLPGEVCKILQAVCKYNKSPEVLEPTTIDAVANVYFTHRLDDAQKWATAATPIEGPRAMSNRS